MLTPYKLAVVLCRFAAVMYVLFFVYLLLGLAMSALLRSPGAPTLNLPLGVLFSPAVCSAVLWFGAPLIARLVSRGLD